LNLYYSKRNTALLSLGTLKQTDHKNLKNRNFIFTQRDKILIDSIRNFKNNFSGKMIREVTRISEEEKQNRIEDFEDLLKEYKEFDFLDTEHKELLVEAEMVDYAIIFRNLYSDKNNKNSLELFFFGVI
jgi:hypothetical protein